MATFLKLFNSLDPDDKIRGKQFEHVCKWYLQTDPVYADLFDKVWLWKEWPDRWKETEAGIDLVAKHKDGTLWAIQSKAYAETTSVSMHDISQFLTESARPQFSYRLLITTTDLPLSFHAEDATVGAEKPVGVIYRTELKNAVLNWPASIADLSAPQPPKLTALPHQVDAINAIVNGFTEADRGQLISACGTGKTLSAMFTHEKMDARRTLVLVPNLLLLQQTLRDWTANATEKFDWRAVCSDMGITDSDPYAAILRPQMTVSELGFPVTTKPQEIAAFLRDETTPRVVFSTYHSSPQITEAFKLAKVPAFDLAIADEAHRVAGPMSSAFATILFADKIKAKKRLFMTATPRNFSPRILQTSREKGFEYASMDEEAKFGIRFHEFGFAKAIKHERLTPFKVALVKVTNEEYREWANAGQYATINGTEVTDARTVAGQIAVAKAMRDFDLHRILTFHNKVKDAKDFAASLPEMIDWMPAAERPTGALWSKYADGTMTVKKRSQLLDQLRGLDEGERGMLSSARCLAEGIDVPTLDGIAFIDPKRSEVEIAQAVGRAIRLADGKKHGYIVIPVFMNPDEEPEVAILDSSFNTVWLVLRAMAALDEELAEFLDNMRRQKGYLPKGGKKMSIELPEYVDMPDLLDENFARAFMLRLMEMTTASWEEWFGMLEQFIKDNDHALVPKGYQTANGDKLGSWVIEQRTLNTDGTLKSDRKDRLSKLEGWAWNLRELKWEENFQRLLEYVKINGDALVPRTYEDCQLGRWVVNQRSRRNIIGADRERRLSEVEGWVWHAKDALWEQGFRHLLKYVEAHGTALVADGYMTDNGYALGKWVGKQRAFRKQDHLKPDREQRLGELKGWVWDAKVLPTKDPVTYTARADQWEENFRCLEEYVKVHDNALVPYEHVTDDGYNLGKWVTTQRRIFKKNSGLEGDREARLSAVKGWAWSARDAKWENGFNHLKKYIKANNDATPPRSYKDPDDGFALGSWVQMQRTERVDGTLDSGREQRLLEVGWVPVTDWHSSSWEKGLDHLLKYLADKGDACVPSSYKDPDDDYPLGKWAQHQRSAQKNGKLDPDREKRLGKLKGWAWATK